MKTFVKENWYKFMIGSSMFIFSVSALIYSVSPARAENVFKAKSNAENVFKAKSNSAVHSFYVVVNGVVYFTDGTYGLYSDWKKCKYQPGK